MTSIPLFGTCYTEIALSEKKKEKKQILQVLFKNYRVLRFYQLLPLFVFKCFHFSLLTHLLLQLCICLFAASIQPSTQNCGVAPLASSEETGDGGVVDAEGRLRARNNSRKSTVLYRP